VQYAASPIAGAKFIGVSQGGQTSIGHHDRASAEIVKRLILQSGP
jgi:hypothetical protein